MLLNGYREDFINAVKKYRETFKEKIIIAGNVDYKGND